MKNWKNFPPRPPLQGGKAISPKLFDMSEYRFDHSDEKKKTLQILPHPPPSDPPFAKQRTAEYFRKPFSQVDSEYFRDEKKIVGGVSPIFIGGAGRKRIETNPKKKSQKYGSNIFFVALIVGGSKGGYPQKRGSGWNKNIF